MNWENRIVGHANVGPATLKHNRLNWRLHPENQQAVTTSSLSELGWIQSVIVNQQTGNIVDGHLRVSLALRKKETSIPVVYVDLSPEEEALALATFDPISAMAETDAKTLEELLRTVSTSDEALQEMLDNLASNAGIVPEFDEMPEEHIKKPKQIACPECGSVFTV